MALNIDGHLRVCLHSLFQAHDLPGLQCCLPPTGVIYQVIHTIEEANIPPWQHFHGLCRPQHDHHEDDQSLSQAPSLFQAHPFSLCQATQGHAGSRRATAYVWQGSQLMCETDAESVKIVFLTCSPNLKICICVSLLPFVTYTYICLYICVCVSLPVSFHV